MQLCNNYINSFVSVQANFCYQVIFGIKHGKSFEFSVLLGSGNYGLKTVVL